MLSGCSANSWTIHLPWTLGQATLIHFHSHPVSTEECVGNAELRGEREGGRDGMKALQIKSLNLRAYRCCCRLLPRTLLLFSFSPSPTDTPSFPPFSLPLPPLAVKLCNKVERIFCFMHFVLRHQFLLKLTLSGQRNGRSVGVAWRESL